MFQPAAFRAALGDPLPGERAVYYHDSVDSTSSDLLRRVAGGAPAGTVVVAGAQTGGRGRQGRDWFSPSTGSLYLSVAVQVAELDVEGATLRAGEAGY